MSDATETGRTAEDEMEAKIGFAFARYLSATDLDVSLRRRVRAAVEPIIEDLIAARKERDEAQDLADKRLDLMWMDQGAALGRAIAAEAEAAQLRSRLLQAEKGGEISGRDPDGSGYSGSAPSPMVSASGEYPSRGQMRMIKRLTKAYRRNDWPTMSEAGKHFALNRMADALRKVGFGLVALGIEARQGRGEGSACESPTPQGGMPEALAAKAAPLPDSDTGGKGAA